MQDFPGGPLVETAGSIGSNPSQETKISRAKKKKKEKMLSKITFAHKKMFLTTQHTFRNNWSQEQKDDNGTKNMRSGTGLQEATYQN